MSDDRVHPEFPDRSAPEDSAGAIWVEQTLNERTGRYATTLRFRDEVVPLTGDLALGWARDVLDCAHMAAYDAAVLGQLTALVPADPRTAVHLVQTLRADRPAARTLEAIPIELTPGVSASSGQPFLILSWHGEQLGQWTVADARGHALHLLESLVVADLDSAYLRLLRRDVGLELPTATQVVHGLVEFRDDETASGVGGAW